MHCAHPHPPPLQQSQHAAADAVTGRAIGIAASARAAEAINRNVFICPPSKMSLDNSDPAYYAGGPGEVSYPIFGGGIDGRSARVENLAGLSEYFSGKKKNFDLPVKHDGTVFQQKVWSELMNITYGKTISYLQLAQRLKNVKAIRAAASANGRNMLSIIVPCHRVIGSDGSLTGYGGGLHRKKWLLDHENKYANGVSLLF